MSLSNQPVAFVLIKKASEMVAISLYRGNLHSVADVPRRWLMPTPKISPRDFKTLCHRRSKALCRLRSTTTSNPNSNHIEKAPIEPKLEAVEEEIVANNNGKEAEQAEDCKGGGDGGASSSREDEKDDVGLDGADFSMKPADDAVNGDPNPNNLQKPDDVANNPSVEVFRFISYLFVLFNYLFTSFFYDFDNLLFK